MDGLRGIAIILVMLHHFGLYGQMGSTIFLDAQIKRILLSGWIGVDLFFVLSGFLITGILLDSKGGRHFFRNFYARRFLRIFPLYYGFLFGFLIVVPLLYPVGSKFVTLLEEQAWYWTYLINFKIGFDSWPDYYIIGHFWSLAVEEQFYLFWPLTVFFLRRRNLLLTCCALLLVSLAVRIVLVLMDFKTGAYVLTPARMDALAMGGLLSIALRSEKGKAFLSRWTRPTLWCSGFTLIALFFWKNHLDPERTSVLSIGLTALAFFFGALLILAITAPPTHSLRKLFSSRLLRFFGRYSYALYVFHHLVAIYLPAKLSISIPRLPTLFGSQIPGLVLFSIVATVLSLSLALLSWFLLESRFLALKRFFAYNTSQG